MSETPEQQQIDYSLPDHIEMQIRNRGLGLTQAEFGALQTNFFDMQARVEALMADRMLNLQIIAGLKKRAFKAEDDVKELQKQLVESKEQLESIMVRIKSKKARANTKE